LIQAVERGSVSVSAAADVASLADDEQREIVARGEREILQAAQQIRAKKTEARRAERLERIAAQCDPGPLPQGPWPLIFADPPWRYEFSQTFSRAIESHYETMELEQICALAVGKIAAPNAVLFLCVPQAKNEQAFQVINAWGFQYRSGATWVKSDGIGEGHYFRNQHELVLLAIRGDFPPPPPSLRLPSVITAPRGEHSEKPDALYETVERMYPTLPRLELFARRQRPGWTCWGNEIRPPLTPTDKPTVDGGQKDTEGARLPRAVEERPKIIITHQQIPLLEQAHRICGPGSRQVVADAIHAGVSDDRIAEAIKAAPTAEALASAIFNVGFSVGTEGSISKS
jgi:N6-adenosine-specific RNA methylase IME4